jgi:hypothetical protein
MNIRLTERVSIAHASIDVARRYISDLERLPEWDASALDVHVVKPASDTDGGGAIYIIAVDFSFCGCLFSGPTHLTYTVQPHLTRRRVMMAGRANGIKTLETYNFELDTRTSFTLVYEMVVTISGWRQLFFWCIERRTRFLMRAALQKLKRNLEQPAGLKVSL